MIKNFKWKIVLIVLVVGMAIWKFYPPSEKINLGLDLKGGMYVVLRVDTSKLSQEAKRDAPERALEVIRNRIDRFGVSEPSIQIEGRDRIIVQLPGITERQRAIELIGKTAVLEFKLVAEDDPEKLREQMAGEVPEGYELKYLGEKPLLLHEKSCLTGEALVDAGVDFGQLSEPIVTLEFNRKGARRFARITRDNIGKRLAIVLDEEVYSAPVIKTEIPTGKAIIEGRFSQQEAHDLAIVLKAGALPAPVQIEEERTIGPTLGRDSIQKGIKATIAGGILVVVFMSFYYMLAGLIANFALCLNLIILLGALSYFKASLTLPGIAGIVLTIGMAVDANVLIFERIREELKLGKTIRLAISTGYKKAFLTIFDSNLTTLITAAILFRFGTGPVRGFATTLSIGIMASMFTAMVVTRLILDLLTLRRGFTVLEMHQFLRRPQFNFIGKRKSAYLLSSLVILIGLASFVYKGERNFGIDFSGGSLQQFRFSQPVAIDEIRGALKEIDLGSSPIQEFGEGKEILIRTYADRSDEIIQKFHQTFQVGGFELLRTERVGPTVGRELTRKAIWALLLSVAGICLYVSYRFEFRYAAAGIVALFHDVFVTIGILSLTAREISLPVVGALLMIVGYSINDTIVIFDRIRENFKTMRAKSSYQEIVNISINQTLNRTLITSLTTFLVVLALCLAGGEVIRDFAFTLLVGVITGTYSSIFVAAPIVVDWPGKRK